MTWLGAVSAFSNDIRSSCQFLLSCHLPMNRYTHAPLLNPNILLGTLQLLMWVVLHPSAWRNHIARIATTLDADFTLAQIQHERRKNPALRRLLVQIYLIWPLLVGGVVALVLTLLGRPLANIIFGSLFGLSLGLVTGIIIGLIMNVAAGLAAVVIGGTGIGLASGLAGFVLVVGDIVKMIGAGDIQRATTVNGIVSYVAIGIIGSIAASIPESERRYKLTSRIGGIFAGILLSAIVVGVSIPIARATANLLTSGADSALLSGMYSGVVIGAVFALTLIIASGRVLLGLGWGVGLALMVGLMRTVLYGIVLDDLGLSGIGIENVAINDVVLRVSNANINTSIGFSGLMLGPLFSAAFGTAIVLPFALVKRFAGPWASIIAGTLGGGGAFVAFSEPVSGGFQMLLVGSFLCIAVGLAYQVWLPVLLYPFQVLWNSFLLRLDQQQLENKRLSAEPSAVQLKFRRHSVFWDERQRWPMSSLEDHLLLALENSPTESQAAMEFLSSGHQKKVAQSAQIELDARRLEDAESVAEITSATHGLAAGELEGPASSLLRTFGRIGEDLSAALAQESAYNQRLALGAVEDRLDGLLRELTRSSEPYADRFRPVATDWRTIVADKSHELASTVELRQEIDSPYIIGVPLTAQQEIFVGRTDISVRIEQLLLNQQHAPLLLYGQRRMGKTSLLNNLGRLLPSTIVPMFVDMQGPTSLAGDYAGFLYNLARGMSTSARRQRDVALPKLARADLQADPFTIFDEWLDSVEETLGDQRALLALDEIEALDEAITSGRFEAEAVLGTLRHIIQHRPQFKLLLTSSHALREMRHWASYLVNVQTVAVGYLSEAETTQLIERPVPDFSLRYEPDAVAHVRNLTSGHPALTQLICYEIVALKNEGPPETRRLATVADVEAAIPNALESGSFFFTEMANQVGASGQAVLRAIAEAGNHQPVSLEALRIANQAPLVQELDKNLDQDLAQTVALLCRRDLIEEVEPRSAYRFEVELFRRWFAQ